MWIDFAKFKAWLHKKYQPIFIKYYGVIDHKPRNAKFKIRAQAQAKLYAKMQKMGYEVITKPLKYIKQTKNRVRTKGDVDLELALDVMKHLNDIDEIILITGDSDYLVLAETLVEHNKTVHIISFRKLLSSELRTFAEQNNQCDYWILETLRQYIEL